MAGVPGKRAFGLIRASIMVGMIACSSSNAFSEETAQWDKAGNWDIRVDHTLDYGCFMVAGYEGGTVLRIGWYPPEQTSYVMIGNGNWQSIEAGGTYDIEFQFGDRVPWEAPATGRYMDDLPVLVFSVSDGDFMQDLAEQSQLKVSYQGEEIDRLKLNDSYKALKSMLECQDTVMSFDEDKNTDPFKEDSEDPFAR